MAALRTMYELPYVMHFISVNKKQFGFPAIDIEVSQIKVFISSRVCGRLHCSSRTQTVLLLCSFICRYSQEFIFKYDNVVN